MDTDPEFEPESQLGCMATKVGALTLAHRLVLDELELLLPRPLRFSLLDRDLLVRFPRRDGFDSDRRRRGEVVLVCGDGGGDEFGRAAGNDTAVVHRDDVGGSGEAEVDGVGDDDAGAVAHEDAGEALGEQVLSAVDGSFRVGQQASK